MAPGTSLAELTSTYKRCADPTTPWTPASLTVIPAGLKENTTSVLGVTVPPAGITRTDPLCVLAGLDVVSLNDVRGGILYAWLLARVPFALIVTGVPPD